MTAYEVIVVGTDGSPTSLLAVDCAARMAAQCRARLILASAYLEPHRENAVNPDQPTGDGYKILTGTSVYSALNVARGRARVAGAPRIEERAILGAPITALLTLIDDVDADLLVVGRLGVNSVAGRLFGSVPTVLRRRVNIDFLIADTTTEWRAAGG